MQQSDNPYQPSQVVDLAVQTKKGKNFRLKPGSVFVKWEKRRILYNVTLLIIFLGIGAARQLIFDDLFWLFCGVDTLFVNLLFFLGFIIEFLISWTLQRRIEKLSSFSFVAWFSVSVLWIAYNLATSPMTFP
jgi:hypothetical protein